MKLNDFKEKELNDYSSIEGGVRVKPKANVSFTVNLGGFFDGSFFGPLFDKDKETKPVVNELDDTSVGVEFSSVSISTGQTGGTYGISSTSI